MVKPTVVEPIKNKRGRKKKLIHLSLHKAITMIVKSRTDTPKDKKY
jgi:hypothetical protein